MDLECWVAMDAMHKQVVEVLPLLALNKDDSISGAQCPNKPLLSDLSAVLARNYVSLRIGRKQHVASVVELDLEGGLTGEFG